MSGERNTEIWSTRLQRELLGLTSNDAPSEPKDAVQTVLPSFVTFQSHELSIENGNCLVSFLVDLPAKEGETESPSIVVALDTSLPKKQDGTVDPIAVAYPFMKPLAILQSGASRFPEGSSIKDGDLIDIEMDWTPSLHLTDAILNIGLKIKESISQGESFHPAPPNVRHHPVGDMVDRAKRLGTTFSKGIRGLASQDKVEGDGQKRGLRLPVPGRKKKEVKSPKANPGEVRIGDEINMLEAPWVDCQGVYSCKAIRRPAFVDDAMAVAAQMVKKEASTADQQVSSLDGDGEVPGDLKEFMQAQAGGLTKVGCLQCNPFLLATDSSLLCVFLFIGSQRRLGRCRCHVSNFYTICSQRSRGIFLDDY